MLNFLGSFVSAIATFGLTVVVTRLSSQAEAGLFFAATSLFLLATALGQLGTNAGLVYFLSGARARQQLHHAGTYLRTAAIPVLVVAVLMSAILLAFAAELGLLLSPGREAEFATYVRAMALFVPCTAAANLVLSATRGLGTMKVNALLDQMLRPLLQVLLVGLALLVGVTGLVPWAWSAAYLPVAVLGWLWWRRLRNRAAPQVRDRGFRPAGTFWRFSAPRALAGVAQVAMQRLDIILVGMLAGLPAAAVYAAATRFLTLGQMVARAVALSVQPLLGEALARRDMADASRLYRASTAWIVLITWPLYLLLINFGATILGIFGPGYSVGATVLVVLCSTMLVATASGMVDMVLLMAGKSGWNLFNVLCALTANLVLDLILIPRIGILGAAVGWGVAILMGNVVPLAQVNHWFRLHPLGRATGAAMGITTAAFALVPAAVRALLGEGVESLVLAVVVGLALYVGAAWRLRDLLELKVLVAAVRRRRSGRAAEPAPDLES